MTSQHSLTAARGAHSKTQWKVGSFAPPLTTYAQVQGPLASGEARRFDREALKARLADTDEQAAIARGLAERMIEVAARDASVELTPEIKAFVCSHIARANAFVHALHLLRAALPQAQLSVKRRPGDSEEPVWVTARATFESPDALVDRLEQLSHDFRAARSRGWDHSVMLDLRRER
jgi:hypothetical protein